MLVGIATYYDGLSAPCGMIELFYGSEEGIEVDKDDSRPAPVLKSKKVCCASRAHDGIVSQRGFRSGARNPVDVWF